MYAFEDSGSGTVPMNHSNKIGKPPAESEEGRRRYTTEPFCNTDRFEVTQQFIASRSSVAGTGIPRQRSKTSLDVGKLSGRSAGSQQPAVQVRVAKRSTIFVAYDEAVTDSVQGENVTRNSGVGLQFAS